jgi:hypothetical protein
LPTPRVRVTRHVARPVTRLIIDYSVCRDFVLRPCWLYFSHAVRRDYLSRGNTVSTLSMPRAATTLSWCKSATRTHRCKRKPPKLCMLHTGRRTRVQLHRLPAGLTCLSVASALLQRH